MCKHSCPDWDPMMKLIFQLIQIFASQATLGCSFKEFAYVIVDFPPCLFFSLALFVTYHLSLLFLPDLTDVIIARKLLHSITGIRTIVRIIYFGNSSSLKIKGSDSDTG